MSKAKLLHQLAEIEDAISESQRDIYALEQSIVRLRVISICSRISVIRRVHRQRSQRCAERLWDAIDRFDPRERPPEPLWDAMLIALPWAFSDPRNSNSIWSINFTDRFLKGE